MTTKKLPLISIVVPLYNEQAGLVSFHTQLQSQLKNLRGYSYEILYCNDGSTDRTLAGLQRLAKKDQHIRLISLSRNFGKEIATTAGIQLAKGAAILIMDADGEHPIRLIPKFIQRWEDGSKVVIGMRRTNQYHSSVKRLGSKLFYYIFNQVAHLKLDPAATDYRLIDQAVQADFVLMNERNRITRGLIDWLGYERAYVSFAAQPRAHDRPSYSFRKLCKLAIDSVVSLSSSPLYITAYIGAVILPLSMLLGLAMVTNLLLGDPLGVHATGSAYVTVLVLFLTGIVMMSQGIIGLYLSHIHSETQNRPLYVIDRKSSVRL